MLDDDLQLAKGPSTPPPPMIEEGMPHALVVKLIGTPVSQLRLEKGSRRSLRNEIFYNSAGKYDLLFDRQFVAEIREQPLNVERLPAKVIAALMATDEVGHAPSPAAQLETETWPKVLIPWLVFFIAITVACFIPYVATLLQIVAIFIAALPVIYLGLLSSPVGLIYLGVQFFSALLSDSTTVSEFLYGQFMLIVTAAFIIVTAVIVFVVAEPVGGVMARFPKSEQLPINNPANNVKSSLNESSIAEQTPSEETEKQTAKNLSEQSSAASTESTESTHTTSVPEPNEPTTNKDVNHSTDTQPADTEPSDKESIKSSSRDATVLSTAVPLDPYSIFRTWQDHTGAFKIEAKCVSFDGEFVTLERPNGKSSTVKISRLSKTDIDWLHTNFPKDTPH